MANLLAIAARVAAGESNPDWMSALSVGEEAEKGVAVQEDQGVVKKTPGKGYCVKSEKNPDWSGGCYPSKGKAKERLDQVEFFKHKGSVASAFSPEVDGMAQAHMDALVAATAAVEELDSRGLLEEFEKTPEAAAIMVSMSEHIVPMTSLLRALTELVTKHGR
jgi:hypothetical protein